MVSLYKTEYKLCSKLGAAGTSFRNSATTKYLYVCQWFPNKWLHRDPFSSRSATARPLQAAKVPTPAHFPALGNDTETIMSLEEVDQTGNKPTWVCVLVEEFWKTICPLGRLLFDTTVASHSSPSVW